MDIKHYFNPVSKDLLTTKKGFWGAKIITQVDEKVLARVKVVIFSVDESRNALNGAYKSPAIDIRKWLYNLSAQQKIEIADFGELKPGKKVDDTYAAITEVIGFLKSQNIISIVIGGSHDLSHFLAKGLIDNSGIEQVICDPKFDVDEDNDFHNQSFITKTLIDKVNLKTSVIGYQSYFVSQQQIDKITSQNIDIYRLGYIRNQFTEIEPLLRDADYFSFDLSAIRHPDCPQVSFASPNGLYAEEACQLAHLAGLSDKVKSFGLFEFNGGTPDKGQSAHLIAQLIWHFILGVVQRKGDYPAQSLKNYKKIYVKVDKLVADLIFYKNELNKRYWLEVPGGKDKLKIIACSEQDYKQICNNQIPDRLWKSISFTMK